MRKPNPSRRDLFAGGAALAGMATLGGCDKLADSKFGQDALQAGEDANLFVQRLLLSNAKLAPEYRESEISPWFKPNGTEDPSDKAYKALAKAKFAAYRLEIGGLVETPLKLSLGDLRSMPSRTQITRHDCVEGWSCIGKWTGVPVGDLLKRARLKPEARYVVLYCADTMEGAEDDGSDSDGAGSAGGQTAPGKGGDNSILGGGVGTEPVRYYESIDLVDAHHPQTILAYDMNGADLPVAHGAPLRLRLERQLGYKSAKYVMRLDVVEKYTDIRGGRGGYWEDNGYDWYAGI